MKSPIERSAGVSKCTVLNHFGSPILDYQMGVFVVEEGRKFGPTDAIISSGMMRTCESVLFSDE